MGWAAYAVSAQIVHAGSGTGYLTAAPSDQSASVMSAVFFSAGSNVRSDLVVMPSGTDGTITLVNVSPDPIDVILDIEGWYAQPAPTAPAVSSSSLTDGGTVASPAVAADFTFQSAGASGLHTAAVSYRYWLDDAVAITVLASASTVTIPAVSDGVHDLLVVGVDAAGAESASTIFSWMVGDGQQPLASDPTASGPALATLTTTETVDTTNDDGTTTTTTSTDAASTPAQDTSAPFAGQTASQLGTRGSFAAAPQNLPGGGAAVPTGSCRAPRNESSGHTAHTLSSRFATTAITAVAPSTGIRGWLPSCPVALCRKSMRKG